MIPLNKGKLIQSLTTNIFVINVIIKLLMLVNFYSTQNQFMRASNIHVNSVVTRQLNRNIFGDIFYIFTRESITHAINALSKLKKNLVFYAI